MPQEKQIAQDPRILKNAENPTAAKHENQLEMMEIVAPFIESAMESAKNVSGRMIESVLDISASADLRSRIELAKVFVGRDDKGFFFDHAAYEKCWILVSTMPQDPAETA